MSCQAAIPLGAQAANTVLARLDGTRPATVNQAFTGQCISLGRRAGTIQMARTDDTRCRSTSAGEPARTSRRRSAGPPSASCAGRPASRGRTSGSRAVGGRPPGGEAVTDGHGTDAHAGRFTLLRPLLFTIAYEILGSATEADDVLQDSYLRWAQVDLAEVRDTKSYLAQLVTRQALNTLRAEARRREDYVGPWLPETAAARRPGRAGRCGARRVGVDGHRWWCSRR